VRTIRERLAFLDAQLAAFGQRQADMLAGAARTRPRLQAALDAAKLAEQELADARREAAPYDDQADLGILARRTQFEDERAALQAELAGDLAPWVPAGATA
jgi:hypothetical protein